MPIFMRFSVYYTNYLNLLQNKIFNKTYRFLNIFFALVRTNGDWTTFATMIRATVEVAPTSVALITVAPIWNVACLKPQTVFSILKSGLQKNVWIKMIR
jgi:hypothetical protein